MGISVEEAIHELRNREEVFVAYSQATKLPYVTCDDETFNDQARIFATEEEIKEYGNKEYFFSQNVPEAESYIIESAYAFQDASYTGSGIEVSSSNTADTQYDISFTSFNLVNGRVWLVRGENSPRYLQLIVKYTKLTD